MVDEELIRQEADSLKIAVTNDEIQDAIELVALRQKKNAVQFKLSLIQNGVFFENYAKQIESELLWSKIISEVLRSKVKITESETKEFLNSRNLILMLKNFLLLKSLFLKTKTLLIMLLVSLES